MRAENRYKALLWHHECGVAKIETFYADSTADSEYSHLHNKPYKLDETARSLFEKEGWHVMIVKYDGPSTDVAVCYQK
jgi:hypothetical protein